MKLPTVFAASLLTTGSMAARAYDAKAASCTANTRTILRVAP
jgi:hypothetical protein